MGFRNAYLSVSRLKMYLQCPRAFFWNYVEKVPKEEQIREAEGPLVFGNAIHATLEGIYKWIVDEEYAGPFPTQLISPTWRDEFREHDLTSFALFEEGLRILREYAERNAVVNHMRILGLEQEFRIKLADGYEVYGFIDRTEKIDDETVKVIDYKTNRRFFTKAELENDLQMPVYGMVVRERYPWAKKVEFAFDMVTLGFQQHAYRTSEQLDDVRDYLVTLGKKTESEKEWTPRLNENCGYCEFRNRCEVYKLALSKRHPKTADLEKLDEVVEEYEKVTRFAKAAYARKKELEVLLEKVIAERGPFQADGKTWDIEVTKVTSFDAGVVIKLLREAGVGWEKIVPLLSVSKKPVEELLKSLEGTIPPSKWHILKHELPILAEKDDSPRTSLVGKKK